MSYFIQERKWRLERRVPPALIFAMLLQIAAGLAWAAQLDARVARIEKDIDYMRGRIDAVFAGTGRAP